MKVLAVNVGNSRYQAGLWKDGEVVRAGAAERMSAGFLREVAGAAAECGGAGLDGVALCSVAPRREGAAVAAAGKAFPGARVERVGWKSVLGIGVDLTHPEQTGADRYADAVAGAERFGTPCIVCDFGTATTFNLVLPKRGFCGGVIAPGYGMWFRALGRGAEQLPSLAPGGAADLPTGRCTEEAIRLGARWGFRGMVTEILWQLAKSCGKKDPVIAATGGWAGTVAADAGFEMAVVPELTLEGIGLIWARSREGAGGKRGRGGKVRG